MNYTVNANIYKIVDSNNKKKAQSGDAVEPSYKKEPLKKRTFSLSTGSEVANFTTEEIITKVKEKLNITGDLVDVKLLAYGKELNPTEVVTAYGVKFEASIPVKTPVVEETVVETPVVETPVVEETPENPA